MDDFQQPEETTIQQEEINVIVKDAVDSVVGSNVQYDHEKVVLPSAVVPPACHMTTPFCCEKCSCHTSYFCICHDQIVISCFALISIVWLCTRPCHLAGMTNLGPGGQD